MDFYIFYLTLLYFLLCILKFGFRVLPKKKNQCCCTMYNVVLSTVTHFPYGLE